MPSIMLVEDERIVRTDLKSLIDWEQAGFPIVCEATDGQEGLELFHRYAPDVVITDIRMPVMDGLEMIGRISEAGRPVQFVILTSYDDFNYARTAIKYGVHSYLLKHEIDGDTLLAELDRLAQVHAQARDYHSFTRKKAGQAILYGCGSAAELERAFVEHSLPFHPGRTFLLLLTASGEDVPEAVLAERIQQEAERMGPLAECVLLPVDSRCMLLLLVMQGNRGFSGENDILREFTLHLGELPGEDGGPEITVATGARAWGYGDLLRQLALFQRQLPGWFFHGGSQREAAHAPKTPTAAELDQARALFDALFLELDHLAFDSAAFCLRELFAHHLLPWQRRPLFDFFMEKAALRLERYLEGQLWPTATGWEPGRLRAELAGLPAARDCLELLIGEIEGLRDACAGRFSAKTLEALRCIHTHYGDNLTLEGLARELGVSSIYAGRLFKRETGMPFKAYLTRYRVQRAVELLQSGRYRIYEVSDMVGYQTVQYFSEVFKEVTGKRPSDYSSGREAWEWPGTFSQKSSV